MFSSSAWRTVARRRDSSSADTLCTCAINGQEESCTNTRTEFVVKIDQIYFGCQERLLNAPICAWFGSKSMGKDRNRQACIRGYGWLLSTACLRLVNTRCLLFRTRKEIKQWGFSSAARTLRIASIFSHIVRPAGNKGTSASRGRGRGRGRGGAQIPRSLFLGTDNKWCKVCNKCPVYPSSAAKERSNLKTAPGSVNST